MKAPSEKHLEDWIVDHFEALDLSWLEYCTRQLRLPSGIADVVACTRRDWSEPGITVCELKRGPIDSLALSQLVRYMADLRAMLNGERWRLYEEKQLSDALFDQMGRYVGVHGILIGHGVAERHLLHVCEELKIFVFEYNGHSSGEYSFRHLSDNRSLHISVQTQLDYPMPQEAKSLCASMVRQIRDDLQVAEIPND